MDYRSGFSEKLSNPVGLAVLDITDYYNEGQIITRINVPEAHRGRGIGNRLLKQCLTWADANNITLWLEINAYGDMSYEQLQAWYERNGFKEVVMGMWRRKPNSRM